MTKEDDYGSLTLDNHGPDFKRSMAFSTGCESGPVIVTVVLKTNHAEVISS